MRRVSDRMFKLGSSQGFGRAGEHCFRRSPRSVLRLPKRMLHGAFTRVDERYAVAVQIPTIQCHSATRPAEHRPNVGTVELRSVAS
jgi:hypothetical protein